MDLRDMEYFLAIAREGSITGAAKALHLSQPALTRQLKELEGELGKQLVIRGRTVTLTQEGMLLRKRAEEILELAQRTERELQTDDQTITGDVYICAGETQGVRFLTQAARHIQERCPGVRFHVSSGDTADVLDELEKGLMDFGLLFGPVDQTKFNSLPVPYADTWGVLMRQDCDLAGLEEVEPRHLAHRPLIVSRGPEYRERMANLLELEPQEVEVAATYSLLFNASLMVRDGLGLALCLDNILNLTGDTDLCFRPLAGAPQAGMNVIWKRYQVFSRAAEAFLTELQSEALLFRIELHKE